MSLQSRLLVLPAALALLCGSPAQEVEKTEKPAPPAKEEPKPPEVQAPPETPEERIAKLEAEIARLRGEIAFVQGRQGSISRAIADRLERQAKAPELRIFDAGHSRSPALEGDAAPRKAKVATGTDAKLPDGVVMSVNGRNVMQNVLDDLIAYLGTFPSSGTEDVRRQRASMELIRTEVAHNEFNKTASEAFTKIRKVLQELEDGGDFAELAKKHSAGPGAAEGGDPGPITRNSHVGLTVEQVAFGTEPGKMSPIFRTYLGYNLLKVEKGEKGENPDLDKVHARLIVVPFADDLGAVNAAQRWVALGQVDITIRDEESRKLLPASFR